MRLILLEDGLNTWSVSKTEPSVVALLYVPSPECQGYNALASLD